ncbi:hypothetical protein PAXINDRAFT_181819, partial [Paxillus involutus ATCC 200175]
MAYTFYSGTFPVPPQNQVYLTPIPYYYHVIHDHRPYVGFNDSFSSQSSGTSYAPDQPWPYLSRGIQDETAATNRTSGQSRKSSKKPKGFFSWLKRIFGRSRRELGKPQPHANQPIQPMESSQKLPLRHKVPSHHPSQHRLQASQTTTSHPAMLRHPSEHRLRASRPAASRHNAPSRQSSDYYPNTSQPTTSRHNAPSRRLSEYHLHASQSMTSTPHISSSSATAHSHPRSRHRNRVQHRDEQ